MSRAKAMSDEDPMLLAKRVLAVPREHGDAVIHAGLHGHTMRRTLETWIEAHRLAVGSGNLAANEAAEGEANRVEAGSAYSKNRLGVDPREIPRMAKEGIEPPRGADAAKTRFVS
jgi:hypothetical protein